MKVFLRMVRLQFKMLLRNRALMISSLGLAVVSMLIFGLLFSNDNNRPLAVGLTDLDKSPASAQVTAALEKSQAIKVTTGDQTELVNDLKQGQYAAVVVLQPGFGSGLTTASAHVQLYVDNTDIVGAARSRGTIGAIFDEVSKQSAGFKDVIQVDEQQVSVRQQRQIDVLTPGMLGMTIMFANMFVGVALIGWRERGTLKRLSATPLKAWQLIGAQIVSQLALSLVQAALILGIAATVFNVQVEISWLPALGVLVLVGAFSIVSLGYVIGNFVEKQQAAQSTATLISLPMMFLGGSYFVVDPPTFLKPVVEILPLTHLNRALRQVMLNDAGLSSVLPDLGIMLAFGVVLLALSLRTFKWSR
jgi:ABC-2 type transport system permease protein